MKRLILLFSVGVLASQMSAQKITTTTASERWEIEKLSVLKKNVDKVNLSISSDKTLQDITGFGGTFNELGWEALQYITPEERDDVMKSLYSKDGCNFNLARTPVAASDYAFAYYSYCDIKDDYNMRNFSISRDRYILIPYIKEALKLRPDLRIWASPWTPPAWMKINEHYSLRSLGTTNGEGHNRLDPKRATHIHTTGFNMQVGYLQAYALYFSKYIQEYKNNGVNIEMIMPQNEIAWQPAWPSCTWRPEDLAIFVGDYLGPQFEKDGLDTQIWLGTINYGNPDYVRSFFKHKSVGKYVKGIGIQWSGKQALPKLYKEFGDKYRFMQTENECGDGENNWGSLEHSWEAMVHCFNNGVNSYMYWNMVLDETGKSAWEWPQNSLVIIDRNKRTIRYTDEYYLMKHFSHYVEPGSKLIDTNGEKNVLAFKNPDGETIVVVYNPDNEDKQFVMSIDGKQYCFNMKAKSINTISEVKNK